MRNVYKGYQAGKMAIPKVHVASINKGLTAMHTPKMPREVRVPKEQTAKIAKRVGKSAPKGAF